LSQGVLSRFVSFFEGVLQIFQYGNHQTRVFPEQGPEYTIFTHYYTDVIRTPIGWDDGDLVAGFGGALVTEYKGTSADALDYVYDMEYNRFYMLTGTHDAFFFATIGNHDVSRHYDQPQREGEHVYQEYLGDLYYSFNYSNTHFVFPDDYQDDFCE